MDIRTKLALALVSVSLISMAILGTFAYKTSASLLKEISTRQLDALAESKKRDLIKVYEGWQDQVRLIRSRTQLRTSVQRYLETGDDEALVTIRQIIEDAATAVNNVDGISVTDLKGDPIVGYGDTGPVDHESLPDNIDEVRYVGTKSDRGKNIQVGFNTLLNVEGHPVGALRVIVDASDLFNVTGNYTGLGESGEAMVVMLENEGTVAVLNPLRHEEQHAVGMGALGKASSDVQAVLGGKEKVFTSGVEDYRGVDVWSATRYVPGLEWGLIVKVDAKEEERRANELKEALIDISLALSAFAIVGGTLLGLYLAKPIHNLVEVVGRIRHGETTLRADSKGDDEVAYLAESLNELMDHLQSESDNKRPDA